MWGTAGGGTSVVMIGGAGLAEVATPISPIAPHGRTPPPPLGTSYLTCGEACARGSQASSMAPPMNHDALRYCFDAGLRLTGFAYLFTSAPALF